MDQNQQTTDPTPSYDFILQTAPEPEKKSFMQRLNKKALFIAIALLLALITMGMVALIDSQAKANEQQTKRLIGIAQIQTEVSRVASIGVEKSEDEDTRARAQSIKDSIDTSLQTTLKLLAARGTTPDEETLNATADTSIDDALEKTIEFGKFDKSFEKIIDAQLIDYQQLLLQAEKAGNSDEQQALQAQYEEANSMLGLVDESE
ncbi:MAG: hypothetical protein U0524_01835 [Candidatus Saccharimonadales bacterium]